MTLMTSDFIKMLQDSFCAKGDRQVVMETHRPIDNDTKVGVGRSYVSAISLHKDADGVRDMLIIHCIDMDLLHAYSYAHSGLRAFSVRDIEDIINEATDSEGLEQDKLPVYFVDFGFIGAGICTLQDSGIVKPYIHNDGVTYILDKSNDNALKLDSVTLAIVLGTGSMFSSEWGLGEFAKRIVRPPNLQYEMIVTKQTISEEAKEEGVQLTKEFTLLNLQAEMDKALEEGLKTGDYSKCELISEEMKKLQQV